MSAFLRRVHRELVAGRAAAALALLEHHLAPRRRKALSGPTRKQERAERRAADAEETAAVRAAVMERAAWRCESCSWKTLYLELDHWLGGSGRRRQAQSVETCWALCTFCHGKRTRNRPSAADWNERRRLFCARHGYPFVAHVEHQALPTASLVADAERSAGSGGASDPKAESSQQPPNSPTLRPAPNDRKEGQALVHE